MPIFLGLALSHMHIIHQNRGNGKTQEKHKSYLVSNKICLTRLSSQCTWGERRKGSPTVRLAVPCDNGTTHVYAGRSVCGSVWGSKIPKTRSAHRYRHQTTRDTIERPRSNAKNILSPFHDARPHTQVAGFEQWLSIFEPRTNARALALMLAPPTVPSDRNAWLATFVKSLNTSRETAGAAALSSSSSSFLPIHLRIW